MHSHTMRMDLHEESEQSFFLYPYARVHFVLTRAAEQQMCFKQDLFTSAKQVFQCYADQLLCLFCFSCILGRIEKRTGPLTEVEMQRLRFYHSYPAWNMKNTFVVHIVHLIMME